MNFTNKFTRILPFAALLLLSNGCDKTIEEPVLDAYAPADLDAAGGTWKPYVLNPADGAVPAPAAINSSEYQAELQTLKQTVARRTAAQTEAVRYWQAGGVFRWHEIARDLAAVHNVPPAYDAALGKYPVPDPANPNADPKFPFANPPYAARVFAYLAVAQYDALVAAWKAKYQYARKSPALVDGSIETLLPKTDLPAYPSEDAVVAAASLEVLKLMFPGDVDLLTKKYEEHRGTRLWAGANVPSDLNAGDALGKAVAAKVLARAKTDGMGAANNQAVVAGMRADAQARGLTTTWETQELPARPPLLPNYGTVKTWNFGEAEKIALRPGPPPALGSAEFEKDMNELRGYAKNLTREQHRIASYWSDGVGSYTPPGHWNREAAKLTRQYRQNELRAARTMALVGTAVQDAGVCCWDVKYLYFYPRPYQLDPAIKTTIGLPNFPSYTSGHSTFSAAAATVLGHLFPAEAEQLNARAKEASESRIYGGIHYRFDCEVGLRCGANIAQYAVKRAQGDGAK